MADIENCLLKVANAFEGKVDKDTLKAIKDELVEILNSNGSDGNVLAAKKALADFYSNQRLELTKWQKQQLQDIIVLRDAESIVFNEKLDDPTEGIKALISGSEKLAFEGANNSMYVRSESIKRQLMASLLLDIQNERVGNDPPGALFDLAKSGTLEKEIDLEVFNPGSTGNARAAAIAKIYNKYADKVFQMKQQAGINLNKIKGWLPQTHSKEKMLAFGDPDASRERWVNFVRDKIDIKRTFNVDAMPADKIDKFLNAAFDDIVLGKYHNRIVQSIEDAPTQKNYKNVQKQLEASRQIHFKDGESAYAYNKEYGIKDRFETMLNNIHNSAINIAQVEFFGSNPKGNLNKLITNARQRLSLEYSQALKAGDVDTANKKSDQLNRLNSQESEIKNIFNTATGELDRPLDLSFHRAQRAVQTFNSLVLLGSASISAVQEVASFYTMMRNEYGVHPLKAINDSFTTMLNLTFSKKKRMQVAKEINLFIDDTQAAVYQRFGINPLDPEGVSRIASLFFKYTGLQAITEGMKYGSARMISRNIYSLRNLEFDKLPDNFRHNVAQRYRINAENWNVIRQAEGDLADGTKGVTIDSIEKLAIDDKLKRDTIMKYQQYLTDHMEIVSPTPNARDRNIWLRGTQAGTVNGILMRLFAELKGQPTAATRLFRRVAASDPSNTGYRGLSEIRKGGVGSKKQMAEFMIAMISISYIRDSLQQALENKTPRDPTNLDTLRDIIVRSGVGGVIGDVMLNQYSIPESLVGPTATRIGKAINIANNAASSDKNKRNKAKRDFDNMIKRNIPFNNVWWAKYMLKYHLLDATLEKAIPGYQANELKKLKKRRKDTEGLLFDQKEFIDDDLF